MRWGIGEIMIAKFTDILIGFVLFIAFVVVVHTIFTAIFNITSMITSWIWG
jgi:hypothetical protein